MAVSSTETPPNPEVQELVERLNEEATCWSDNDEGSPGPVIRQAADMLTRLSAEPSEVRAAFCEGWQNGRLAARNIAHNTPEHWVVDWTGSNTRAALAALRSDRKG